LPNYKAHKQRDIEHPIEKVGAELRSKMTWLSEA
jgi:ketol-acid reductoisomerase